VCTMEEAASTNRSVRKHPARRTKSVFQYFLIPGRGIQRYKASNRPTIFSSVHMSIDPGYAQFSPLRVVESKVRRAVLACNQVGVLACIERTFRRGEERFDVPANLLSRMQINWIMPEAIGEGIHAQILRLHLHDLFEVGRVPVASG